MKHRHQLQHKEPSLEATAEEMKQLEVAYLAVKVTAYDHRLYATGGAELDQFCTGEQEAVRSLVLRDKVVWEALDLYADDTQTLIQSIDRELGEWMMRCVTYNRPDSLLRLAKLIEILHEDGYDGTFKRRVTADDFEIKQEKRGRPRGDSDPRSLSVIFASAMLEPLRAAVQRRQKLLFSDVRNTVDSFQSRFMHDIPLMSDTQFNRCIKKFGLQELVVSEQKKPGPKKGTQQIARNSRRASAK